jgi:uncharacterized cupin superfamily protein
LYRYTSNLLNHEIKTHHYLSVEKPIGINGESMTIVIDLTAELAKLTMLRGRTPQTTSADRVGTSAQLAAYRDGALFTSKFSGKGAWERHMTGDELVHILDGAATLDIVTGDGPPQSLTVRAGMVAIVPQGA